MKKLGSDPANSIIYTFNAQTNKLITNIKYQDKNKLAIQYDDSISILYEEKEEHIISFSEDKIIFASIELTNYAGYLLEKSSGIFSADTGVVLRNIVTAKENVYTVGGGVKQIKTYADHIALNLGSGVHFINTNGWLIKKYTSQKEIKDIVLGQSIAGILYKDKIEIINI